jgi:hypothetical protein
MATSTKRDKLDLLFNDVIAQSHNGGNPLPAKVKLDDGLSRELRYRRKLKKDWSQDVIKRHIEAKMHIHDPPSIAVWTYKYAGEIARQVFEMDEVPHETITRTGRALAQLSREHPAIQRVLRDGRIRYLTPPVR